MATDTVPAAVPGPPEPTGHTATTNQDPKGFLASMVAAVEPARSTFDLTPTTGQHTHPAEADGALDRSAPGVSSDAFRDTTVQSAKDAAGQKGKAQGSVWKAWWLAGAQRWAKGGGGANKRLDVKKAQAQAHQVKETRTTTVAKSGGLPVRNSGGSGAGISKGPGKADRNSAAKGPSNGAGNRPNGPGRGGSGGGTGGSGGGRGSGGGSGSSGSTSGGRSTKGPGPAGKNNHGPRGPHNSGGGSGKAKDSAGSGTGSKGDRRSPAGKDSSKTPGTSGGSGKQGPSGKSGKDGAPGKSDAPSKGTGGKTDLTKTPKNTKHDKARGPHNGSGNTNTPGAPGKDQAKSAPDGKSSKAGKDRGSGGQGGTPQAHSTKTPLEKSRETGHSDGTKARRIVDHVKAYTDGARDGWGDEKTRNRKEHDRLNKAHTAHKPGPAQPVIVSEKEDDGVTTDVKPLTVQSIDANTLTLGADATRTTYGRRELRNFKQYERKLEAKETVLQKISDACKQLEKEADKEAKDCQDLLEQAKSVEGGEKLVGKLTKLADTAKNQATEAAELAKQAKRAAEMCKVVLTNIQTRYAPLYKAVVDSDETKPAELRFYNDKGTYAPAA